MTKKSWETPKLTTHGSIEDLTQVDITQFQQLGQFVSPNQEFDLWATMQGT